MWALLLGQALMGFAYGPLFPLAITYIDDQVRGTTTPYYIGEYLGRYAFWNREEDLYLLKGLCTFS